MKTKSHESSKFIHELRKRGRKPTYLLNPEWVNQKLRIGAGTHHRFPNIGHIRKGKDMPTETKAQTAKRLIHSKGGIILICGEFEFPSYIKSQEQAIIWDDTDQDWLHKEVPSNVRAIFYNIWVSHTKVKRLRSAAQKLHIPIFPMQTKREMIETISNIFSSDTPLVPSQETSVNGLTSYMSPDVSLNESSPTMDESESSQVDRQPAFLMKEDIMRPPNRGEMQTVLLPKYFDSNMTVINEEARRLVDLLKEKESIKTTQGAVAQAIYVYKKNGHPSPGTKLARKVSHQKEVTHGVDSNDLHELKKMLVDARAALDLVIDSIPKLEKEMTAHRGRAEKLRKLLLGELE